MTSPYDTNYPPNSFTDLIQRNFWNERLQSVNYHGILFTFIPLIVIIVLFFVIRHYVKSKKILFLYLLLSILCYVYYFLSSVLSMEIVT